MTERIERIERVKPVENDVSRRFDTRNNRNARNSEFLREYRRFLNRKNAPRPSKISDAYDLELTNATMPALFYFGDSNIRGLLN